MTLEGCQTFCAGYTYWGVEYGRECTYIILHAPNKADCYFRLLRQ